MFKRFLYNKPITSFLTSSLPSNSCFTPQIYTRRCIHKPDSLKSYIFDHGNCIEAHPKRWPCPLFFSYVWLRDNCRCSSCYCPTTFQKLKDVYEIPLNIRPTSVQENGDVFAIKWPDGHISEYDFKFLWENTYEAQKFTLREKRRQLWSKFTFPALDRITVPLEALEIDPTKSQKSLMEAILQFGVGIVSQVPTSAEATRKVVEEIGPPLNTFFGDMWTFRADAKFQDSAYSNNALGCHTDTTYLSEAARIQVFHCLEAAEEGGETLLVDGFHLGEILKEKDPECFEFLSSCATPSEYVGDSQFHKTFDVAFRVHPLSGSLVQFRYNIYDRSPPSSIPFEKMDAYYKHLRTLTSLVRNPSHEIRFKLRPGQVLFMDNWRVLHGRSEFQGSRTMTGCYLGNSDFNSKARTLGFHID